MFLLDSLERIEKLLADIKVDISHMTRQYQHMLPNNKLNLNVSNRTQERRSPTPSGFNELSFPLRTVHEIDTLQRIL